ncbi:hypothetical protein Salat_0246100 [Sesamum alatum]|uniref:Uncharacterized protein n=1 Tax=Sesamum alatum TaxID=300844 RepID=A0AAE2CYG2_9LAMI|nr:hypothetical protein Salat_0246100 [Sesamum alatum]
MANRWLTEMNNACKEHYQAYNSHQPVKRNTVEPHLRDSLSMLTLKIMVIRADFECPDKKNQQQNAANLGVTKTEGNYTEDTKNQTTATWIDRIDSLHTKRNTIIEEPY